MAEYVCKIDERRMKYGTAWTVREKCERVVRCQDCAKWHECDYDDETTYGTCEEFTRPGRVCSTRSDGFCAWGRRRQGA